MAPVSSASCVWFVRGAVFEQGVAQQDLVVLLAEALAGRPRRDHVDLEFPQRLVFGDGPELVRMPDARQDQDVEVGEQVDDVEPPIVRVRTIDSRAGGQLEGVAARGDGRGLAECQGFHVLGRERLVARPVADAVAVVQVQRVRVPVRVVGPREHVGPRITVQIADVIDLGLGVQHQLPVGALIGLIVELERHALERKVLHAPAGLAQIFGQGFRRVRIEIDEDEAFPHVGMDRH